ncbi:MAG: leucine-rich repeat protein [Alphaproteobacteria bacterium]|nr:leucine-rich repeat protein [Alphaproteobacteria bacterium]
MKIKILTLILSFGFIFSCLADNECDDKEICTFNCAKTENDSCIATLDKKTNTLTLKGYGDISDYEHSCTPKCHNTADWGTYSSQIYKVVLENESNDKTFKSIGATAFEYMYALKEVVLPEGLEKISNEAFNYDVALTTINLPTTLKEIGAVAFDNTNISDFVLPSNVTFSHPNMYGHLSSRSLQSLTISGNTILTKKQLTRYEGDISAFLTSIFCENTNESCKNLQKDADIGSKIKFYEKYGDQYYMNGKFYASPSDISKDCYIKKRIYTIDEANHASKPTGNIFKIRYK